MSGVSSSIDSGNNSATKLGLLCLFRFRKTRISALARSPCECLDVRFLQWIQRSFWRNYSGATSGRASNMMATSRGILTPSRRWRRQLNSYVLTKKDPPRHEEDQAQCLIRCFMPTESTNALRFRTRGSTFPRQVKGVALLAPTRISPGLCITFLLQPIL
jgi:hypothetical protein